MTDETRNLEALASSARTATNNSADLKNNVGKGCHAVIDMAAVTVEGTVDLTGGVSGSVDGIEVNGVEIMSGAENFDTNLTDTATNVAANITANTSNPDYTATSSGTLITIKSVIGGNGFTVVASVTTITTTDVNMSSSGGVVFKIQGLDTRSGKYYDIIVSASVATVSTVVLKIHPALTAAANLAVNDVLPQDFRVLATHSNSESMTYSVSILLV